MSACGGLEKALGGGEGEADTFTAAAAATRHNFGAHTSSRVCPLDFTLVLSLQRSPCDIRAALENDVQEASKTF